jgi:hypothetical protein
MAFTPAQLEVNRLRNEIEETQENIQVFQERLQDPNLTAVQRGGTQRNLDRATARLAELQTELVAAEAAVASEPVPQPAPPATAAQTAKDDAPAGPTAAPEQKVGTDGRVVDVPPNTAPSNAEPTPTQQNAEGTTSGTDAPTKSLEQTQAINSDSNNGQALRTPAAGTGAEGTAGEPEAAAAVTKPGAASQPDDNIPAGSPQSAVNAEEQAGPNVKPRPNVLDEYASYSYSASVYLMSEVQYAQLLNQKTKKIDGYQLLFQSGGAANNVGGIRPRTLRAAANADNDFNNSDPVPPDGGRNPFFDNDFYIDSISIENLPPGNSTGSAHNISTMKFTLIEPNGITLLDRLYDAVANLAVPGADGKINYTSPTYLMVIRFYGYDANGNLEQVRSKPDQEGTSDPAALVEKFFPFQITSINWSVGSKMVSYEWECKPTGQLVAGYASRGTIPADVQLVNTTVGGLLGGPAKYSSTTTSATNPGAATTATSTDARQRRSQGRLAASQASAAAATNRAGAGNQTDANQSDAETRRLAGAGSNPAPAPAPSKADAAPTNKTTITGGLMGAMNEFQAKLVRDGVFTVADEYAIEFIGPDAAKIRDAKLQLPNTKVDKRMTAAGKNDPKSLDQAKTSVDMISRSFSITAGQQLLQAIDMTIRNSSYISDQALVIVNPDGTTQPNPNSRNKPLKWFTIAMSAVPIGDKIDPKRNDYAYRITYTVAAREVKSMISKYFPVSKFTGVHKSYPYWFTGQNSAVLEYQETLNNLYQLTVSGSDNEKSAAAKIRESQTSSMADLVRYNYAPTSTESNKGADGKSFEAAANAAEVLYSPGDLAECKVKIVGDPAWIMQGSTFRVLDEEMLGGLALTTGFLPDGSIAFDNQDVLFEINWQRPEDYNLDTGLADPYSQTQKKYNNRTALQSRVYRCKKVLSEFRHGAFTQTLEGAMFYFPIPNKTNTANPAAANKDADPRAAAAAASRAQFAANDPRRLDIGDGGKAAILGAQNNSAKTVPTTNTTGVNPSSSTARGVDQTLNPPKTLAEPTLTQLQSSPTYTAARRAGQTPEASLQAARNSFAATAGGSPVTSNGSAVATKTGTSPPTAGNNARLTPQQIEQQATSQRNPPLINRET